MRRTHVLTLALMLTGMLAGCAGVGKQDFACPGHPSKPLCLSASEVYRLTDGDGFAVAHRTTPRRGDTPSIEDALFMETP